MVEIHNPRAGLNEACYYSKFGSEKVPNERDKPLIYLDQWLNTLQHSRQQGGLKHQLAANTLQTEYNQYFDTEKPERASPEGSK